MSTQFFYLNDKNKNVLQTKLASLVEMVGRIIGKIKVLKMLIYWKTIIS